MITLSCWPQSMGPHPDSPISKAGTCAGCSCAIWIGIEQQRHVAGREYVAICHHCAVKLSRGQPCRVESLQKRSAEEN